MKKSLSLLLLTAATASSLFAQEKADPAARMREALRSMSIQVRDLQAEKDQATVKNAQLEKQVADLEGTVKAQAKRATEDKEAYDALKAQLAEREASQRQLSTELVRWKDSSQKATEQAAKNEAARAALAEKVAVLERTVADQRTRNLAMFNIGKDILTRYEKFGLGTALTAREPFVGTTRVKLENLVQDYADKLSDQRIKQ